MTRKLLALTVVAFAAVGAHAQMSSGGGSASTQPGSSTNSSMPPQQAPAYRSMPSKPSTPSGPTVSGGMATPDTSTPPASGYGSTDSSIGGSGSAGLAAMGGGAEGGTSATSQMGAGAMTDCPMGTSRKMGLCVPYGQARKKQP